MEAGPKCWVCLRSPEEIRATVGNGSEEETRIGNSLLQVAQLRSKFAKSSELWAKSAPAEFMAIDLQFILDNSQQFESIGFLAELVETKSLLERLGRASNGLRNGEAVALEVVTLPPTREEERGVLTKELQAFEDATHRRLEGGKEDGPGDGHPEGVAGLSLADGLDYLRAGGMFYFDVQSKLLEWERSMLVTENPKWQVGLVRLEGIPEVPLCSVCQGLLGKTPMVANEDQAAVKQVAVATTPVAAETRRQPSDLLTIGLVVAGIIELVIVVLLALHS